MTRPAITYSTSTRYAVMMTAAAISVLLAASLMVSCNQSSAQSVAVERQIDDTGVPRFDTIQVIVLPTGERVLVMSGPQGLGTCCLLPPIQKKQQIESTP